MSTVEFPASDRVSIIGGMSQGEVVWSALALAGFIGVLLSQAWVLLVVPVLLLVWTFTPNRRDPLRVRVPARVRWMLRRDKVWDAPLRGEAAAPFLDRAEIMLGHDELNGGAVGVVCDRKAMYTTMMRVQRPSMAFATAAEQNAMFAAWSEVLASLCVEKHSDLAPSFVGWTDVHRAADPEALVRHHEEHGKDGPAAQDYGDFIARFGSVASEHDVVVWVSVARHEHLRTARRMGFSGSVEEVMSAAAISLGRTVGGDLKNRGFEVSGLLSPAAVARLLGSALDPWRPEEPVTHRERAGLAEWHGPRQVTVDRSAVAVDRAWHRTFLVEFPRAAVDAAWLWKPLGLDGPKMTTAVFVPVPPSKADMQREAFTTRGMANNRAAAGSSRGRVRERDRRKVASLARAELAVAEGHQELDSYMVVVVSARSREELERRTQQLRQRLREAGRGSARELAGQHDTALGYALPIGRLALRAAG